MKKTFLFFFLLISTLSFSQNWKTNFEDAKVQAATENKNIVLVFSGSDWCGPCIKLDKNIWQSDAFKKESAKKWVLVRADFPKKKANQLSDELTSSNKKLAEKYNKEGNFPLVVVVDSNGKVIGKTGYANVEPEDYITILHGLEKK
ncbi:thioredoxin family protein [Flavobacterium sp.]|jgi:thioredoxin-related protein|uniref:thioredoxin family protein n=1 Tax=Flavobacterium sp. TaxID=239 RepID=UPI00286F4680|nr:thioredoxin family protein [Flavobacterium sp.]